MTQFIQLHLLTAYPPANLNRDDTGRPKTAVMGGALRLRVSSQALKRAFRESAVVREALDGHLGQRTKRLGTEIEAHLVAQGAAAERALEIARGIAGRFGKIKKDTDADPAETEQLAFISPTERAAAIALADRALAGEAVDLETAPLLAAVDTAADIAMFGRMLADVPQFNREAAVQVAHALTTHRVQVEDDYFTAVDDLKTWEDDRGAGHVGVAEFAAGLFYLYICINHDLLVRNLDGDAALAASAVGALARAAATVPPKGKQASYAHQSFAAYALAEHGTQQPRSLALAFLKPVAGDDHLTSSIDALTETRGKLDAAYGACADDWRVMDAIGRDARTPSDRKGSLDDLVRFAIGGAAHA